MTVVELADAVPAGAMIAISDTLANMQRAAVAERARTADRSAARESDLSRHDEVSASFDRDAARAGSSFEFEHSDASRAYLRALGFGRENEQTRKDYEGQKLDRVHGADDPQRVKAMLSRTITQWEDCERRGLGRGWKQRQLTYRFWNHSRSVTNLKQMAVPPAARASRCDLGMHRLRGAFGRWAARVLRKPGPPGGTRGTPGVRRACRRAPRRVVVSRLRHRRTQGHRGDRGEGLG